MARPSVKSQRGLPSMKTRIRRAARALFIQRGLSDVSYGDIAAVVPTTRANLHYHFGSKNVLLEAVFQDTFDGLREQFEQIWAAPGLTLDRRIALTAADSEARFYEFNDDASGCNPWSLSARARFEDHRLPGPIQDGISQMSRDFEAHALRAGKQAIDNGELHVDTPARQLVMLITPQWYFGARLTHHSGLPRLLHHYTAVRDTIAAAYGTDKSRPNRRPRRD